MLVNLLHDGVHKSTGLWQILHITFHLFHCRTVLLDRHEVTLHLTNVLLQFTLKTPTTVCCIYLFI